VQGRPLVRGNSNHLPGLSQGLSHPGRDPGNAHWRGGALGADQVTAVILAGGQGTRLRPLTYDRPKPIVPLLNIPFLAYQLALLARHGVRDAVLSCSYMVDAVRATMGDGAAWGVRLTYAVEEEPLGTAGGVRNAVDVRDGRVLVLNGDILTDADLGAMLAFHEARGSATTLYLTRVPDPTAFGLVELAEDGRVQRFIEKPDPSQVTTDTVNAGIYVIDGRLLARVPPGRAVSIEREFFPGLLEDRVPFFGWVAEHYWLDIGNPAKYRQGALDLLAGRATTPLSPAGAQGGGCFVAPGAVLDPRTRVTSPVVIGADCRVAAGASVGPSTVLGRGCVVGAAAAVTGALLWERVEVGAGAQLQDCIVGAGARVGAGAHIGPASVVEPGAVIPAGARLP
jgi:NDP-sugar pyrophosphorylase family protein